MAGAHEPTDEVRVVTPRETILHAPKVWVERKLLGHVTADCHIRSEDSFAAFEQPPVGPMVHRDDNTGQHREVA